MLITNRSCRVLIFVGELSYYYEDTVDSLPCFDPKNSSWIRVDECGGLVTEERPDAMISPLTLFLQGQGYLVNIQK